MNYLLDTHAAIWLLEGSSRLGAGAREAIGSAPGGSVALSDISLLEIAMLASRGAIELRPDSESGLEEIAQQFMVLPVTAKIAADAVRLAWKHKDPFDRVITATARVHRLTLITRDRRIIGSKLVPILWKI